MENIKIAKVCGLCAGCKFAVKTATDSIKSHKNVCLFKEIVHNKNMNDKLISNGIKIKSDINLLSKDDFIILRAHGEPISTYEFLKKNEIEYADCTCVNVKKIHTEVERYSRNGYKIIIIGKYGKSSGTIHPEILGTIGWCNSEPILVEDEEDIDKLASVKNCKFYLVCQTTFNMEKAKLFSEKIKTICEKNKCELVLNLSICEAQKLINISSSELARNCKIMFVVGSKTSSNTTELYNNLKNITKTIFIENTNDIDDILNENNISANTKIGITAGASTDPEELVFFKQKIEKFILEKNMNVSVNSHSSIQIENIFIDPYNISDEQKKAKYIFLTHTHYDHLSVEDIKKIILPETIFIATKDAKEQLEENFPKNKKIYVSPNEEFDVDNIHVETIHSYNINKNFHKKEFMWVGYRLTVEGVSYLICGDSDNTPELEKQTCDVLFVPIGGTYTMTATEAAALTNKISPKIVVPVHYNLLVGTKEDEKTFIENVDKNIKVEILVK